MPTNTWIRISIFSIMNYLYLVHISFLIFLSLEISECNKFIESFIGQSPDKLLVLSQSNSRHTLSSLGAVFTLSSFIHAFRYHLLLFYFLSQCLKYQMLHWLSNYHYLSLHIYTIPYQSTNSTKPTLDSTQSSKYQIISKISRSFKHHKVWNLNFIWILSTMEVRCIDH